jgi:glycosyltransferase involved in cell wall biosynthesis
LVRVFSGVFFVKVGVIIPVRDRPGLVLEALSSVLSQTCVPDRLVVVDDGSTDTTPDRVELWLAQHRVPGWELLRIEHRGAPAARQHGLEAIPEVDLVAFLDSDDLWPADLVQRAIGVLEHDPQLIGASADRKIVDESTGQIRADRLARMIVHPWRWMVQHGAGIGSCSFMRASALRSIGGYPTAQPTGHDIELFSRLLTLGPWGHLPGLPVTFRRHHAQVRGEADHIYRQFKDANFRYACLYEQAVKSMPPADARCREVRRSMARRWISAAKAADRVGDTTGAAQCLSKAKGYQSHSFRAARLKWRLRSKSRQPRGSPPS